MDRDDRFWHLAEQFESFERSQSDEKLTLAVWRLSLRSVTLYSRTCARERSREASPPFG
jgi:hypothetical protein